MLSIYKALSIAGIQFIAVSQGIDSNHEQASLLVTLHGMVDSLYVAELGKKTHRGLEGKVLRGFSGGGTTFGYRNAVTPDGVRVVFDEAHAAVVRRVYELAAEGVSLRAIVRRLNAEGIPSPKPRDKRLGGWCPYGIREMLRNEIYVGLVIWNRNKFIKTLTGKRVARRRPESEWVQREAPELRIISDELWQTVRQQLAWKRERFGRGGGRYAKDGSGNQRGLGRGAEHLLTGLLKCSECGSNLTIVRGYGVGRKPRYGCPNHAIRESCKNDLRESEAKIQERLFSRLQSLVLDREVVEFAIQEFSRQLRDRLSNVAANLTADRVREAALDKQLKNLWDVVAQGGDFKSLKGEIANRQSELEAIQERMLTAGRDSVNADIAGIRAFVKSSLCDITDLLTQDIASAKAWLAQHVQFITMTPAGDGKNRYYVATGIYWVGISLSRY
jgi:site-specific DNA recombinase